MQGMIVVVVSAAVPNGFTEFSLFRQYSKRFLMDISNVMLTDLIIIRATTSGANQFHLEISESSTALNKAL